MLGTTGRSRPPHESPATPLRGGAVKVRAYVLPEHLRPGPFSEEVILAAGWVDLGQHLVAIWRWVEEILQLYDLMNVGLAKSSLDKAKEAVIVWLRDDPCARRLREAEVAFLAQVSSKD